MPPIDKPDLAFRVPAFEHALAELPPPPAGGAAGAADAGADPAFWAAVARLYDSSSTRVNLENGYWGVMPMPVKAQFHHWIDRVNHDNTLLVRAHWPQLAEELRQCVAQALGCGADEITLCRGATEAMLALIGGYNRLQPGDTVLFSDLDYPAMRDAMQWLGQRRGVTPVPLTLPRPPTRETVLDAYAQALRRHPRTRLVLLTHLSHYTGLVLPVRELSRLAQAAGAEVIVDAAHSWGQLDFRVGDLDAPFAAFNLHKWIGAPLGCACLYIRRGSVAAIDPYFGSRDYSDDDIRSRLRTGTPSFAAWLSIPAALQLHQRIGAAAKEARLRHLRNHWVRQARGLPGVEILTPDDPGMVAGITSLRVRGRSGTEVVEALGEQHGVHTVSPTGAVAGEVVRVTPTLTTTLEGLDRLVQGLKAITAAP
jgi:isopenicillin-N epimerase